MGSDACFGWYAGAFHSRDRRDASEGWVRYRRRCEQNLADAGRYHGAAGDPVIWSGNHELVYRLPFDRRGRAHPRGPAEFAELKLHERPAIPEYDLSVFPSMHRLRARLCGGFPVCFAQWRGDRGNRFGFQDWFALRKTRETIQPFDSKRLLYSHTDRLFDSAFESSANGNI